AAIATIMAGTARPNKAPRARATTALTASSAAVPTTRRNSVNALTGRMGTRLASRICLPNKTVPTAEASPAKKVTVPITTAFATNGYRSASALALCTTLLLVAQTVTDAVFALSLAGQIQLLDAAKFDGSISPAQAEAQDARQHLLGTLELTIGFAAGVALPVGVYPAHRNPRPLGAEGVAYSPGWSVGWF